MIMFGAAEDQLRTAAEGGHVDQVQHLLEEGVNINATNKYGNTSLHLAVYSGHMATITALLGHGANLDISNTNGQTPLHLAIVKQYEDITALLVSTGAHLDLRTTYSGMTALHYASRQGLHGICELLLDNRADQQITDNAGQEAGYYAMNETTRKVFERFTDTRSTSPSIYLPDISTHEDQLDATPPILPLDDQDEPDEPQKLITTDSEPIIIEDNPNSKQTEPSIEVNKKEQKKNLGQENITKKKKPSEEMNPFAWSEKFKARQRISVFDRLLKKKK